MGLREWWGLSKCPCQVMDIVKKLRDGYQFHYIARKHEEKYTSITVCMRDHG